MQTCDGSDIVWKRMFWCQVNYSTLCSTNEHVRTIEQSAGANKKLATRPLTATCIILLLGSSEQTNKSAKTCNWLQSALLAFSSSLERTSVLRFLPRTSSGVRIMRKADNRMWMEKKWVCTPRWITLHQRMKWIQKNPSWFEHRCLCYVWRHLTKTLLGR